MNPVELPGGGRGSEAFPGGDAGEGAALSASSQQDAHLSPSRADGEGTCSAQIGRACGQRGWNMQPLGGLIRLGFSPLAVRSRRAASGFGAAAMSSCV